MIKLNISHPALDHLKLRGGQLIIFRGTLTGCCVGSVPAPMLEVVGRPRVGSPALSQVATVLEAVIAAAS